MPFESDAIGTLKLDANTAATLIHRRAPSHPMLGRVTE